MGLKPSEGDERRMGAGQSPKHQVAGHTGRYADIFAEGEKPRAGCPRVLNSSEFRIRSAPPDFTLRPLWES